MNNQTALTPPPRYYAHLLDASLYGEVVSDLSDQPESNQSQLLIDVTQLLDTIALHAVLHSLPSSSDRLRFLVDYQSKFQSKTLLESLPNAKQFSAILSEHLERALISL